MTMLNEGITGAKRQSWQATNPRDLLKQVVERHPNWSRARLLREFSERVGNNEKHLAVIIEYWFANNYHSLVDRPHNPNQARDDTTRITASLKTSVSTAIDAAATVRLLELLMPNGKPLRDCTGQECSQLSGRVGGWLLRISRKVGKTQTVGAVLSEVQVRDLYQRSR